MQIKRVVEFKEKHANVLKDLHPKNEKKAITEESVLNVLKDKDQHGRRILIVNCGGKYDKEKI